MGQEDGAMQKIVPCSEGGLNLARKTAKSAPSGEDQLKERLLKAATEVFLEKGFAATSVDEIASRAKASKLTFYNHFGNKEKLFEAIVTRLNSTMFKGFVDALEADVPMEQALHFFVKQLAEMLYTDQAIKLVRVLHAEAARFPELADIFDRAGPQRAHALLAGYFEQQIRKGILRRVDPFTAADHLIHMALGEAFRRVLLGLSSTPSPKEVESRIKTALKVFMRAYAT
jgi:TetR/AcrR family transcriptional regulator, mexJK operon transcriptional repressor